MSAPVAGPGPETAPVGSTAPGAAPVQKDDYVDKGAAQMSKRAGIDPNKSKKITEKITDALRKQFEKMTGYVCPMHPATSALK
ncbi:MAG: hypothetical protein M1814_002549 [Vezdaea aestivalis]|nr:MAG: hypothetical protein M1814_002549 [Vezdaea aestivalis]